MNCITCGKPISQIRLAALPDVNTCINCSNEDKVKGHVYWDGKHTPILEVKRSEDMPVTRRGFHAQLPFSSKSNPRILANIADINLSLQIQPSYGVEEYDAFVLTSRCHPERPRVSPDGRCLECSLEWYRRRLK